MDSTQVFDFTIHGGYAFRQSIELISSFSSADISLYIGEKEIQFINIKEDKKICIKLIIKTDELLKFYFNTKHANAYTDEDNPFYFLRLPISDFQKLIKYCGKNDEISFSFNMLDINKLKINLKSETSIQISLSAGESFTDVEFPTQANTILKISQFCSKLPKNKTKYNIQYNDTGFKISGSQNSMCEVVNFGLINNPESNKSLSIDHSQLKVLSKMTNFCPNGGIIKFYSNDDFFGFKTPISHYGELSFQFF